MLKILPFFVFILTASGEFVCEKNANVVSCIADTANNVLNRGIVSDDQEIQFATLSKCNLIDVEPQSFEGLVALENLDLSVNQLTSLKAGIFDNLNAVKYLNLSHNVIGEIAPQLFNQLTALDNIDLSNNQLIFIEGNVFEANVNLQTVKLSYNSFNGLPSEIFANTKSLASLDLSHNDMSNLPDFIFEGLTALSHINLAYCNLVGLPTSIPAQNALTQLYVAGNAITTISDNYFNDFGLLNVLDLSKNQISTLQDNVFAALLSLKSLNVSSNVLIDLTPAASLQQLTTLDAANNRISFLPMFNLPLVRYLDVSGNRLTNFGTMVGMNIPKKLKTFRLHKNPWQCGCLEQVLTILRRKGISYEFSPFFDGKVPVCVIVKDKKAKCVRDNRNDEDLDLQYNNVIKKYPQY